MDIYAKLMQERHQLSETSEEVNGVDAFISGDTVKLASMDQLLNFVRIGNDTLVHKAQKDLWRVGQDENGEVFIERLFDPKSEKALRI